MSKYNAVLLFGAPGSGKGLQGHILNTIPGFVHCAVGDIFRSLDTNLELGKLFIRYSSAGQLMPTEVTIRIWQTYIEEQVEKGLYFPNKDILILDGIPRTLDQAKYIGDMLNVLRVFYLKTKDKEELINRIHKRTQEDNRIDDIKDSVIKHRIEVYEKETLPILDNYYQDNIKVIDSLMSPLEVLHDIIDDITPIIHNMHK